MDYPYVLAVIKERQNELGELSKLEQVVRDMQDADNMLSQKKNQVSAVQTEINDLMKNLDELKGKHIAAQKRKADADTRASLAQAAAEQAERNEQTALASALEVQKGLAALRQELTDYEIVMATRKVVLEEETAILVAERDRLVIALQAVKG